MKTLHLKLKRDVLIVDLPEVNNVKQSGNKIIYNLNSSAFIESLPEGNWSFLCQGTPTEEQAEELFDYDHVFELYEYQSEEFPIMGDTAVNLFKTLVRREGYYWLEVKEDLLNRQFLTTVTFGGESTLLIRNPIFLNPELAESQTFKNPIIFIKE